ncbi:hypothetical protein VPH35_074981 [Triticum aestivum]
MEAVEGLMKGLRLTAAERKGLRIGEKEKEKVFDWAPKEPQAVGKLFPEKLAHAGVVGNTLGRIWCPIKGVGCKELEENIFLFNFRQPAGWRRALEEGPWWFDKELLVMEEYDPEKTVEEYDFNLIPIWIRVFGLPLGSMNRGMGELIGSDFHEVLDVDVGHDGRAVGKFLRIKVKLDINEPLMRGFTLDRNTEYGTKAVEVIENEEEKRKKKKKLVWCRFEYEHMPDFCYTCGIICHSENECSSKPVKGEAPQFGPWMRAEEENRKGEDNNRGKWLESRGSGGNKGYGGARSNSGSYGHQ